MQKCGKNESRGASERYNYTMAGFAQHKVINKNFGFFFGINCSLPHVLSFCIYDKAFLFQSFRAWIWGKVFKTRNDKKGISEKV